MFANILIVFFFSLHTRYKHQVLLLTSPLPDMVVTVVGAHLYLAANQVAGRREPRNPPDSVCLLSLWPPVRHPAMISALCNLIGYYQPTSVQCQAS